MSPDASRPDGSPHELLFREAQRFRQIWIWAVVLVVTGLAWWAFVEQTVIGRPFGSNPGPDALVWGILAVAGVGLPLLIVSVRLTTQVDVRGVTVRFRPLRSRRIEAAQILSAEATAYRPLRDYGGWGIRYGRRHGWAYTVHGNRGVRLVLHDAPPFLIGSSRAEELAEAIQGILPPGERK